MSRTRDRRGGTWKRTSARPGTRRTLLRRRRAVFPGSPLGSSPPSSSPSSRVPTTATSRTRSWPARGWRRRSTGRTRRSASTTHSRARRAAAPLFPFLAPLSPPYASLRLSHPGPARLARLRTRRDPPARCLPLGALAAAACLAFSSSDLLGAQWPLPADALALCLGTALLAAALH